MKLLIKLSLPLIVLGLCGCSLSRQVIATLRSTSHFAAFDSDRRILYEPGAEDLSREVGVYLPGSLATVEREQYSPFPDPVEVYICATKESFSRSTGLSARKGVTTIKHIFLSAEVLREFTPEIRQAVLTHELSHFHLQQHLGAYKYGSNLPAWFQEGLAEYVSGGASMIGVSDADAEKAILSGKHIVPDTTGSFLFPKRWNTYDLNPNMFYRQSFLYVSYLKHLSEPKFREFMLALESRQPFKDSFHSAFGLSMEEAWQNFIADMRNRQRTQGVHT